MRTLLGLLIAVAGLSVGACAAGDSALPGNQDQGVAPDAGMGSDLAIAQCAVVNVTPSAGTVPLTLAAYTKVQTGLTPAWVLETPSGLVTPQSLDGTGLRVGYEATEPGTYTFHVDFHSSTPCPGMASVVLMPPAALSQIYRVRITPPASTLLPQQDRVMSLSGGTGLTAFDLTLESGVPIPGVLMGPTGVAAGEVQLVPVSGPEIHLGVGTTGVFSLPVRLDAAYRVVLIPAEAGLAPAVLGPMMGAELVSASFKLDAGVAVSGVVHDETAAVVAGASVALRAGALPSGLATSATDGTFALRARAGTYTLSMSKSGWPDLDLAGVVVPAGGVVTDIALALPRTAMTCKVVRADGTTPVSGARVTLRSQALAGAATVTYAATPHSATGVVRAVRTTLADGTVGALPLPAGAYDMLVEPPALPNGATEGITGVHVTVSSVPGEILIKLAPKATINGQVSTTTGPLTTGARIRLRAQTGGAWAETKSQPDGTFAIAGPVGVPLELIVEPPTTLALSSVRRLLGVLGDPLGTAPPSSVSVLLPHGLPVSGTVRSPSASPIGGASIDALCNACGDPSSLAHADSDDTGHYSIWLPDPGIGNVDAGGT